jgi:TfoX/Sxy family transcriptional regulator of competence genes
MPYTSMNGHMFSFLTPDGTLALRLSGVDRDAFVEKYRTQPVEQHGAVMKEYVAVPADLLERLEEVRPWFDRSCDYAGSLKPRATKRT